MKTKDTNNTQNTLTLDLGPVPPTTINTMLVTDSSGDDGIVADNDDNDASANDRNTIVLTFITFGLRCDA
jgi:hypothetical protein